MKKSDKPTPPPATDPQTTSTPPIESTPAPSTTTNQPPETKPPEQPTVETISAPPIGDVKPVEAAPANTPPVATISAPPIDNEPPPVHQAQPILTNIPPATPPPQIPPPGKGNRDLQYYMGLDWTKGNAELAKEQGVSRQAIREMRIKVEKAKAAGNTPSFSDVTKAEPLPVQQMVDYDLMAATVFDMSTGLLTTTFGPEWQPRPAQQPGQPDEREIVCGALKHYFKSKNAQDIPPGLMLTAVVIAYAGPRLRAPNTASKLQMAWTWVKLKLSKLRKKDK